MKLGVETYRYVIFEVGSRISALRACVAKAAGWTLEANKDKIATEHKECKTT